MLQLLSDNFLPNVDTCDEEGFANCILDSNQGVNFDRYDWNADIFSQHVPQHMDARLKETSIVRD